MKKKLKQNGKRLLSLALTVCCAAMLAMSTATTAYADDKQEQLLQQKQQAEAALNEAKNNLASTQALIDATEEELKALQQQSSSIISQINALKSTISETRELIDVKQVEIENKQIDIDNKQAEIDQRWGDLKKRMSAMQRLDDGGSLSVLSNAANLYELLTFSKTLQQIYNKDTEVLGEMETEREAFNAEKADLEAAKQELENYMAQLEVQNTQLQTKQYELASNIAKVDSTLSTQEALAEAQQATVNEKEEAFNRAADEYDSYLKSLIKNTEDNYANAPISCSLNFICPLPSYKYISCYYGDGGHKGVDFAAPGGTTIRAIADGVVITVENHWSYGYYVMVYHGTDDKGNSYTSLYAHMNSWPPVSTGQTVTQGQTIGYVGTTGNSTGNHLHLELRVNGNRTNPLNYVPH
ncbi:MAG: murein hydrolase activator EnvC family protein [Gemmiger sp.]